MLLKTKTQFETNFEARIFIFSDESLNFEVWVREFYPMKWGVMPSDQFIAELLEDYHPDEIRKELKIPEEGAFQCLVQGKLTSFYYQATDTKGEDSEERLEFTSITYQEIPNENENDIKIRLVGEELQLDDYEPQ